MGPCAVRDLRRGRDSGALLDFGPSHLAPATDWVLSFGLLVPCVCLGALVTWRAPSSGIGTVIAFVGVAPAVVRAVELWGATASTDNPWVAARAMSMLSSGFWVCGLAGFVALCILFPGGVQLAGWRWFPVVAVASGVLLNAPVSLDAGNFVSRGGEVPGDPPWVFPRAAQIAWLAVSFGLPLAVLGACVRIVLVRYHAAEETGRTQLRWFALGAGAVPILLAMGWVGELAGLPIGVAYPPFIVALVVGLPAAVTVAILRHDLFDVDRLLGSGLALAITAIVSAGLYAAVVYALVSSLGAHMGGATTGAAFITALCLLPGYHLIRQSVGGLVDRGRVTIDARLREFVRAVRDGEAEAEDLENVLRSVLGDDALRLLVLLPGGRAGEYVDLQGVSQEPPDDARAVPVMTGASIIGVLVLGRPTARSTRRAREAPVLTRLPIE